MPRQTQQLAETKVFQGPDGHLAFAVEFRFQSAQTE
jgi:hypothetical protein